MRNIRKTHIIILTVLSMLSLGLAENPISPIKAELVNLYKVWDKGAHSAFPSLRKYQDAYFVAFREGSAHVSVDGKVRILKSDDLMHWNPVAVITVNQYDLRDPQLLVAPDGRLMMLAGITPRDEVDTYAAVGTITSFSEDGINWSKPEIAVELGRYLWRATLHDNKLYGITYSYPQQVAYVNDILASFDGKKWQTCIDTVFEGGSEGIIRFDDDGTAYCLLRNKYFAKSIAPYKDWNWSIFPNLAYIGGPDLIKSSDGHWIASGRHVDIYSSNNGPTLFYLDPKDDPSLPPDANTPTIEPILQLPHGGPDQGYCSLMFDEQDNSKLWVCYYSSQEDDRASIYLAEVIITQEPIYERINVPNDTLAQTPDLKVLSTSAIVEVNEGDSFSYSITLSQAPTSEVLIEITTDYDVDAVPTSILFTDVNWNIPQNIMLIAVDDTIGQGDRMSAVSYSVSSLDAYFDNAFVPSFAMTIFDDEDFCGKGRAGYMPQDLNQDCVVDFLDFVELSKGWMHCSDPLSLDCISPCG